MATLTPAELIQRITAILDEFDAPERQRNRATSLSLLVYAGRVDDGLKALAELATAAESDRERQRWLDLGDELVRTVDRFPSPRGLQPP